MIDNFPIFVEKESAGSATTSVWELREAETKRIKDAAINQALETIRNRIDQFGVTEPIVQRQGVKQIVVQLPGVKDPKRAKDLIKETALLEFKMLDEDIRLDLPARVMKDKEAEVLQEFASKLPEEDQILFERVVDRDTGVEFRMPYVVKKRVMLTGDVLSDARVAIGQFNDPYVSIEFDSKGGQEFERITRENIKKRMAIVLDNTIYSAPVIQERISGGGLRLPERSPHRRPTIWRLFLGPARCRLRSRSCRILPSVHPLAKIPSIKGSELPSLPGSGGDLHDRVLPSVRADRGLCPGVEPDVFDGRAVRLERHVDLAGDCRHRPDDRNGCRFERFDF